MKKIIIALLGLMIIAGLGACSITKGNQTTSSEPIKIAALLPLTGNPIYGDPALKTATMAMEEINAKGGMNGRKVEINFQDHKCQPQEAVSIFQQLTNLNQTKLFTSVACSGTAIGIAPLLNNDQVLLSTYISASSITGISPALFRNYPSDANVSKIFAQYITDKNFKNVAVIYEETDYAKGLKIFLEKYLEGKDVKISSEGYTSNSKDVRTQLTKLKSTNPEALFISPQTETSGDKILKEMTELSFRPKALIVNQIILNSVSLNKNYSTLLKGAVTANYQPADTAKSQEVLKNYKAKYGVGCPQITVCLNVYDDIYILAEAAAKNNDDMSKVREYIKNINYAGASGNISFDNNNDRSNVENTLITLPLEK